MMMLRRVMCWLFGHRSICLFVYKWGENVGVEGAPGSMDTGWQCERCGHTFSESWDA